MGFFASPEEKAELKRQKEESDARRKREKAEAEFLATPVGQARSARRAGANVFQIDLEISRTSGWSNFAFGTHVSSTPTKSAAGLIEQIEAEGWTLEHVGYVYRLTGSVSTGKVLGSGEREISSGEIVGIYLFRADAGFLNKPTPP